MPRKQNDNYEGIMHLLINPDIPVRDGSHLLMAAVVARAAADASIMARNPLYFQRIKKDRKAAELVLLSIPSLEKWLDDPGVIEFWLSWQDAIDAESVRENIRRRLHEKVS